jgi:hypothetical protein
MERSLRTLRSLRARGRDAFLSDEVVQDRAERHAQLPLQACADIALHILAGTGTAKNKYLAEGGYDSEQEVVDVRRLEQAFGHGSVGSPEHGTWTLSGWP